MTTQKQWMYPILFFALCVVSLFPLLAAHGQGENLLANGDFASGVSGWGLYMESGGSASFAVKEGMGVIAIDGVGSKDYAVQLYYDGFGLQKGGVYRFAFSVTSSIDRQVQARIQKNGGDYIGYCIEDVILKANQPTRVMIDFTMEMQSDPAPRLCFNSGRPEGAADMAAHTLTIDNVEVILLDGTNIEQAGQTTQAPAILANQVGYQPNTPKTAFFRDGALGELFTVVDEKGNTVYTGRQSIEVNDPASGDVVASGDFSAVSAPGTYQIHAGDAVSHAFAIGQNIYDTAFRDVQRFFYYQRCGVELPKELAGTFAHAPCHTGLATVYGTNETKDVSGGWHDAGDYGRYVSPAAKTAADLLLAYEANPALFGEDSGIPQSGNGIADVLDEVRYELDWLLKMQDAKTGGAYHKVTCAAFPGTVMPEHETEPLILSPISTTATGDFAAVMALAARVYEKMDPAYSQTLLSAAEHAFVYLVNNPDGGTGFHNPNGIVTGEYGDANDTDERYWAACELFRTTGSKEYEGYIIALLAKNPPIGFGWEDMGLYGHLAYLHATDADKNTVDAVKAIVENGAEALYALSQKDGYRMTLGLEYPWGSNMSVANNGLLLLLAASIDNEQAEEYIRLAYQHLYYLMGANPMGYCYITGHGRLSPVSTHHRPSQASGETVPGMLSGGPNAGLHDPYAKAVLSGKPPAKCYVDNEQSYATNEVAIYWNSSLLHLMARLMK